MPKKKPLKINREQRRLWHEVLQAGPLNHGAYIRKVVGWLLAIHPQGLTPGEQREVKRILAEYAILNERLYEIYYRCKFNRKRGD